HRRRRALASEADAQGTRRASGLFGGAPRHGTCRTRQSGHGLPHRDLRTARRDLERPRVGERRLSTARSSTRLGRGRRCAAPMASLLMVACGSNEAFVGSGPELDAMPMDGSSVEAATPGRCDDLAPIRLYYWNLQVQARGDAINFITKI